MEFLREAAENLWPEHKVQGNIPRILGA